MKNCIKKMRLSFIAIAVLMGGWSSYSMADDTHRTGLKETTPQEEAFIKKNWKKIKKVKPNKLGLERINKAKKQKNLPLLDESVLAPMGEDVIGALVGVESGTEQEPLGETLPSFVDNSTLPAFPAIRSQGSQGSCVAWASTYYQMTHNTGLMRDSNHTEGDMSTIFSPKWTYNLINHGEDNGAYLSDPFILLEKNGASMWSEFPYSDAEYRKWPLVPEVWRNAISHRTDGDGVQYVSDIDYTAGLEQLKAILTNGYVVTFGTWISSWQYKTVSDDNSTTEDNTFVGDNSAYWMNGNVGGHMMTFVGYSDDIWIDINGDGDVDTGEKGALKVANSWGDWWSNGNDGFIWLAYDALKEVSAVTGGPSSSRRDGALMSDRAYHLIVQNNYTPKVLAEVTLNHAKRDQLRVKLGVTDGIQTTLWYPFAMNAIGVLNTGTGGPYAFDGSTTAIDGTFFFDFTDIIPTYEGTARWYVDVEDTANGYSATLSLFKLVDVTNGDYTEVSPDVPQTVDNDSIQASVNYDYNEGNLLPHAIFEATPISGYMPLEVDFNASESYDDDGSIVHYEWKFGDGSEIATGVHQTHTYVNNGNYTVTLTVTDNEDAHSTSIETIEVINEAPTASFVATPTSGDIPFNVTLDASQSIDNDGQIVEYNWNFGDDTTLSTDTNDSFIHTYTTAGDLTITLTVIDNGGGTDSATAEIEAIDPGSMNAPTGLAAVVEGSTVNLSWSDNSDNEEVFIIQRAPKIRGKYTFADINTTDANVSTFSDSGLELGTYKYRVYAESGGIRSTSSNEVLVKVEESTPPPPPPPSGLVAPTNLSAKLSRETGEVVLGWKDSNSDEKGFIIERRSSNDIDYSQINIDPVILTSYVDDLSEETGTFYYRVKAYNDVETSDASNVKTIKKR